SAADTIRCGDSMSDTQRLVVTYLGVVLVVADLIGLAVRRRLRVSYIFTLYQLAVLGSQFVIATWPERFHVWGFYLFKETLHDVLKFGMAVELMFLIFTAFPAAAVTVRRLLLLILAVMLVV